MIEEVYKIARDLRAEQNTLLRYIENNKKALKNLEKSEDKKKQLHFTIWEGLTVQYEYNLMVNFLKTQNKSFEKRLEDILEEFANL